MLPPSRLPYVHDSVLVMIDVPIAWRQSVLLDLYRRALGDEPALYVRMFLYDITCDLHEEDTYYGDEHLIDYLRDNFHDYVTHPGEIERADHEMRMLRAYIREFMDYHQYDIVFESRRLDLYHPNAILMEVEQI